MDTTQAVNILFPLEYSRTDVSSQSPTRAGGEVMGTREEMPILPVHLEGPQSVIHNHQPSKVNFGSGWG